MDHLLVRHGGRGTGLFAFVLAALFPFAAVYAQGNPNQFGGQDRADAAQQMIVLGVQQGISSLPPTTGQSNVYKYDAKLGTFVASELLGPTSFRSTQTIGKGALSFRFATSYFELSDSFGPIPYCLEPLDESDPNSFRFCNEPPEQPLQGPAGFAAFGMSASAKVVLLNFAVSYGLLDRLELTLNVPVTVVDAEASQSFTTAAANANLPPNEATLDGATTLEGLNAALDAGALVFREDSFSSLGFDFSEGSQAGVSRISLGGKGVVLASEWGELSFSTEFFFPSPSEEQLAGSDSPAILPRFIGQISALDFMRFHTDVGYDWDFEVAELRRFVWNVGASIPHKRFNIDFGVGGSEFDVPIRWTPSVARSGGGGGFPPEILQARGNNTLGDTFIDFLGGIKVRLTQGLVLSGSVNVPLNDDGFRADAVGTVALEYYFQNVTVP